MTSETEYLHVVTADNISDRRRLLGKSLIWGSAAILGLMIVLQLLDQMGRIDLGFTTWRPTLYAYLLWATCLCWAQVLLYGERGKRVLFVLPAALFVVSMVVFPLIFALGIAFSSWNLSSPDGRQFNGLDNVRQMWTDPFYWNALRNMVWYTLAIVVEYAIAFGLALLLNAQIRARKFFRVAFLLPLMLSPVAVSWMIGKSMLETRFGPIARFLRWIGVEDVVLLRLARNGPLHDHGDGRLDLHPLHDDHDPRRSPGHPARTPRGGRGRRRLAAGGGFWEITFPLMLPVSITAILIRIIFKLKLADIIINVTSGGPGGATDTVTSFIFREYRDRSNVGYGTLLAMFYLLLIVIGMTILMKLADRWMKPRY